MDLVGHMLLQITGGRQMEKHDWLGLDHGFTHRQVVDVDN